LVHILLSLTKSEKFKFWVAEDFWASNAIDFDLHRQGIIDHLDPFNSECRAIGHIQALKKEDIAVKCFGYVLLDTDQENGLRAKFGMQDWNRSEQHKGRPIRAIVKELIVEERPFVPAMIPKMIANLKQMYRLGICLMDLREGNYRNGIAIDFSQAYTLPHMKLDPRFRNEKAIQLDIGNPGGKLDSIIDEWNDEHPRDRHIWDRFFSNRDYTINLRQRRYGAEPIEEDFWKLCLAASQRAKINYRPTKPPTNRIAKRISTTQGSKRKNKAANQSKPNSRRGKG